MPSHTDTLTLRDLRQAVANGTAFRARTILQPAGGPGDKLTPHAVDGRPCPLEQRRLPGFAEPVTCVLLDSPASQANRLRYSLQQAIDHRRLTVPTILLDGAADHQPDAVNHRPDAVNHLTTLLAPPAIAQAMLRQMLREEHGGCLTPRNATPLYLHCPASLLFGLDDDDHDSQQANLVGQAFPRVLSSEIIGIHATPVTRLDMPPPAAAHPAGLPFADGVTIDEAEQLILLSLPALRRLHFPRAGHPWQPDAAQFARDEAARTVLAALALSAATLVAESGFDLRARCLLWPEEEPSWELLGPPGAAPLAAPLTAATALALLHEAIEAARYAGLTWPVTTWLLKPSPPLLDLLHPPA